MGEFLKMTVPPSAMMAPPAVRHPGPVPLRERVIRHHALRVLRRLSEPGAILAMRPGGSVAKVARKDASGAVVQAGEVDGAIARKFVDRGWIEPAPRHGQILRFVLAPAGLAAFRSILADVAKAREGEGLDVTLRAARVTGPSADAARTAAAMWSESLYRRDVLAAIAGDYPPRHPVRRVLWHVLIARMSLLCAAAACDLPPAAAARFLRTGLRGMAAAGWGQR